ncbi:MAG: zinc ribbon domain-containing protein [Actinomycetota bacterium]|nr:zinc ribbon domain-containing protein [Actinomycetota bacterium]
MPTYGYRCQKCANEFDVVQKMTDKPVTKCPKCGGPVKRMFHPVGIIFKGSGFYTTDNKKKSTNPVPTETKSETKSDTKPETKSDNKTEKTGSAVA